MTVEIDSSILGCVPHRLADWRAGDDGRVVAERPQPTSRGLRGVWDRLRWLMSHPRIRLDELGSFVWHHLDGETTLAEIASDTVAAFPDRAEGMEQRLALYATALHHQGLIELRVPNGG